MAALVSVCESCEVHDQLAAGERSHTLTAQPSAGEATYTWIETAPATLTITIRGRWHYRIGMGAGRRRLAFITARARQRGRLSESQCVASPEVRTGRCSILVRVLLLVGVGATLAMHARTLLECHLRRRTASRTRTRREASYCQDPGVRTALLAHTPQLIDLCKLINSPNSLSTF